MSVAGAAPAGAAIAGATDTARYLITQINGGVAADRTRVVSSANLAQPHRPGIAVPPAPPMRCRPDQAEQLGALAAQTWPGDPAAVRAHLGLYSDGFLVRLDDTGALYLDHDIRSMPVLAMPEGGDVVVDGPGGDGWAGRQDRAA